MNLHTLLGLTRSLIIFDTETTGPNPAQDRIVEIGFIMINPDGTTKEWSSFINPGVPIPHEATFGNGGEYPGHGITDAMVQACRVCGESADVHEGRVWDDAHDFQPWPSFGDIAHSLLRGFNDDSDYGGYSIKTFDLPLLQTEFERVGIKWGYSASKIVDGLRLWQLGQKRTLSDASELFLQRKHEGAHRVLDDVRTSLAVIEAQLILWPDLPREVVALHTLAYPRDPNAVDADNKLLWKGDVVVFNFGKKWKGRELQSFSQRDLLWIANDATGISKEVREICRDAAYGKLPTKQQPLPEAPADGQQ